MTKNANLCTECLHAQEGLVSGMFEAAQGNVRTPCGSESQRDSSRNGKTVFAMWRALAVLRRPRSPAAAAVCLGGGAAPRALLKAPNGPRARS